MTPENSSVTTIGILDRLKVSATVSQSSTSGGTDPIQSIGGVLNGESLVFTLADTFYMGSFLYHSEGNDPSSGVRYLLPKCTLTIW